VVKRKTQSKRMTRKLEELRVEARQRMHAPVAAQHKWVCSVLRGNYAYFGLPSNHRSLSGFYLEVRRLWYRSLMRRSQRRMTWESYNALLERFPLPTPRIMAPREALVA
jgi:hypothetical protein